MRDRPPTILQIVPELDTGGAELSAIEVADAIVRAGGRALVACAGGRMVQQLLDVGGVAIDMPLASKNPVSLALNANRLVALVKRDGVDLIHARSRAPAWSGLRAARRAGLPFVTTYHGAYGEKTAAKRMYNSVMARGNIVIANSQYTADLIQQRYGTDTRKIRVINRGVDLAAFDPAAVSHERIAALRVSWGVPPEARVILHPARLTRWKGQTVVLDAVSRLKSDGGSVEFIVVLAGDDQGRHGYTEALQAQAKSLGLSDHVRFAGHVSDMPAAFLAADVAIVASTEPEAFGRTAAEAQAVGTPVIATAIGAPRETVLAPPSIPEHAATGRLVAPGDPDALAGAIAALLSLDPDARAAMAARARRHVKTHYSVHQLQDATLQVYDELLNTEMATMFRSQSVDNL
ncbi:MAG: glycosyltransferase family 4 protein [Pseudomonadota bacterium]